MQSLYDRSVNSDLFAWAYTAAIDGNKRIFDPSFALAKDPDIPAKMRRDPIIDQALRHTQQMVAGRKWDVEPGGPTEADRYLATIVRDWLENIRRFDQTRYRLAEARFRGASYEGVEGDYAWRQLGEDQHTRRWWMAAFTKHIDKRMLRQVNKGHGSEPDIAWEMFSLDRKWVELDEDKERGILKHAFDVRMDTLGYAGGLIEPLYWSFFAKGIALQEGLNGLETWARGWITMQMDSKRKAGTAKENDDRVATAITTLENMRSRHVLVYGKDEDLNVESGPTQGHQIVTEFIAYLDACMTRLILGSLLPSGGGSDVGSFARAETESEMTESQIQFEQAASEETLTSDLIGLFMHVNRNVIREAGLGGARRPLYRTVREKVEDPEKNATVIGQALQNGVPVRTEDIYQKLGLTKPEDGDDVIEGVASPAPTFPGTPAPPGGWPFRTKRTTYRRRKMAPSAR